MTNYEQEAVESIRLRTKTYSDTGRPFGVFINGTTHDKDYSDRVAKLSVVDRLNQIKEFELVLYDLGTAQDVDIKYGNSVYFKVGPKYAIGSKYQIRNVNDNSNTGGSCSGYGYNESVLIDKLVENTGSASMYSQDGRPQYEGDAIKSVLIEQLMSSGTGIEAYDLVKYATGRDSYDSIYST